MVEALPAETVTDPPPRYTCFVEGCPGDHESKWLVCPERFRGFDLCPRCARTMRRQLMGSYICDFCRR